MLKGHFPEKKAAPRFIQFKANDIDQESGDDIARQVGPGFEFWWISCGRCGQAFGAIIFEKESGASCAHCDTLLAVSRERREEIRAWRRAQSAPN